MSVLKVTHLFTCLPVSHGKEREIKYTAMHGLILSTQRKPTTKLITVAHNGCELERPLRKEYINFENLSPVNSTEISPRIGPSLGKIRFTGQL